MMIGVKRPCSRTVVKEIRPADSAFPFMTQVHNAVEHRTGDGTKTVRPPDFLRCSWRERDGA